MRRLSASRLPSTDLEQIVEVVCNAAGQMAYRLQLLRLPKRLLGFHSLRDFGRYALFKRLVQLTQRGLCVARLAS